MVGATPIPLSIRSLALRRSSIWRRQRWARIRRVSSAACKPDTNWRGRQIRCRPRGRHPGIGYPWHRGGDSDHSEQRRAVCRCWLPGRQPAYRLVRYGARTGRLPRPLIGCCSTSPAVLPTATSATRAQTDFRPGGTASSIRQRSAAPKLAGPPAPVPSGRSRRTGRRRSSISISTSANESTIANPLPADPPFQVGYNWRTTEQIARVGLNYKFGWGGPVVAKY